jgi:hypothetical protein
MPLCSLGDKILNFSRQQRFDNRNIFISSDLIPHPLCPPLHEMERGFGGEVKNILFGTNIDLYISNSFGEDP